MSSAIRKLIAKIETGKIYGKFDTYFEQAVLPVTRSMKEVYLTSDAYHGSLDAALALHNAVLPGWDRQIGTCEDDTYEASVAKPLECQTYDGTSHDMARAWLLAILGALESRDSIPSPSRVAEVKE